MRFLFVDRILQLIPGEVVRGLKHITGDDSFLCKTEDDAICFIPSLIGETIGQLAAWNVMDTNGFRLRPVAGVVSKATLHRPARLGETLYLEAFIESLDDKAVQYHGRALVGEELVFSIEGALGPLLPMEDFIDPEIARRQFLEIHRPADLPQIPNDANSSTLLNQENITFLPMCFDRILEEIPGVSLKAEKRITRAAPFFADHFPNKPVLPLTLLLEYKINLAREFLRRQSLNTRYLFSELRRIKMSEFVFPGDIITTELTVKEQNPEQLILHFRTEVLGKRVCILDLLMVAKHD